MDRRIKIWSFGDVDRSGKVRWTAEELGYEIEESRVELGGQLEEPYRSINPYEQIPAAELDGNKLIESTAICILLAERAPESGLIPEQVAQRDLFWQISHVATTTLETPVVLHYLSMAGVIDPAWRDLLAVSTGRRLTTFAAQMPEEGYICNDFTLADIFAAYCLRIGVQAGLLRLEGRLERYLRRLMDRPAAQAARFFDRLEA